MAVLFRAGERQHGAVVVPKVLLHLHPVHVGNAHAAHSSAHSGYRPRYRLPRGKRGIAVKGTLGVCLAERVGCVPVVLSSINDLGPIQSPQITKSTRNLGIRYKSWYSATPIPHRIDGSPTVNA